jgi:hypothetical protein
MSQAERPDHRDRIAEVLEEHPDEFEHEGALPEFGATEVRLQ